jgi:putative redox protein
MMDGPTEFGGANAGTRPKELLLLALGGCTASDVISILQKRRVELDGFEIHITAKQRDEHPQVFSEIHLEYVIRGNHVRQEDVARAIELSESKYCSVSAMLRPAVPITWTYRIEPSRAARPAA